AQAAAVPQTSVVLPTPPLPVKKISFRVRESSRNGRYGLGVGTTEYYLIAWTRQFLGWNQNRLRGRSGSRGGRSLVGRDRRPGQRLRRGVWLIEMRDDNLQHAAREQKPGVADAAQLD